MTHRDPFPSMTAVDPSFGGRDLTSLRIAAGTEMGRILINIEGKGFLGNGDSAYEKWRSDNFEDMVFLDQMFRDILYLTV
jgi:hypothetical protein